MLKNTVILLAAVSIIQASPAGAGWIDDWMDQTNSAGSSSFEGQKRQYYSAGYYSARYRPSKDYAFSVNAPKVKMGCGGIDIMLGSFAYLKPDELVDKIERIITSPAAAAFAFNMALDILCEPCKNSMNELEKMLENLNAINIDDCKAAKTVATVVTAPLTPNPANTAQNALKQAVEETGAYDTWKQAKESAGNTSELRNNYNAWKNKQKETASGGTNESAAVVLATAEDNPETGGSVIAKAFYYMATKNSQDYSAYGYKARAELVRAFIGDYVRKSALETGGGSDKPTSVASCSANSGKWEAFLDGTVQIKPVGGNCAAPTDAAKDTREVVRAAIDSIMTKMQTKAGGTPSTWNADETRIINEIKSTPIYSIMEKATVLGVANIQKPLLVEHAANLRTLYMYRDLVTDAYTALDKLREAVNQSSYDATEQSTFNEKISELQAKVIKHAKETNDEINEKTRGFNDIMLANLEMMQQIDKKIDELYSWTGYRK